MIVVPGAKATKILQLERRKLTLQIYRLNFAQLAQSNVDFDAIVFLFDDYNLMHSV